MSENVQPVPQPSLVRAAAAAPRRQSVVMCGLLLLAYFAMRLPNLRSVPIFCDEAIYLRWAQLIWENPAKNLFVSMVDAKITKIRLETRGRVDDLNADSFKTFADETGRTCPVSVALSAVPIEVDAKLETGAKS